MFFQLMFETDYVDFFAFGVDVGRHDCLSLISAFMGAICVSVTVAPAVGLTFPVALDHRRPYLACGVIASCPTIIIACVILVFKSVTG